MARRHRLAVSSLLGAISLVHAVPQLAFPVNVQVPPLAVAAQPFSFTFSPSTFSYDTPSISYSVSNNTPSWLKFDAGSRTFTGTPQSKDVGNFTFTLSANDTTGTASGDVTLLVVADDGVAAGKDVGTQLVGFGGVDGDGGIVLSNERPFSWQFSQDTFTATNNPIITYYAVSTGHTPLPSWIKFYAENITFVGASPEVFSQIAPPQYFTITLIAASHYGYASASQTFDVVIGAHDLTINPTINYVNTTIGGNVSWTFPLSSVNLDGKSIDKTNVTSIIANMGDNGSWLTFDNATLVLAGKPAQNDKGTTVTLAIQDVFDDIVHATIQVDLFNGLFTTTLPSTLNATIGESFTFVLNDTLFAAPDVQLSVSFKANGGENYLSYNSDTRTISGTPLTDQAKSVEVDINASSASLNEKQSTTLTVDTINSSGQNEAPKLTSPSSSSSTNKALIIGLSIGFPIAAVGACSAGVFFYRRRRKSKKSSIRAGSPLPPISRPYNTAPDADWPLEEEKSWGEPRQLGDMDMFKRGMSGPFTLKTSEVGTTAATVGREPNPYDQGPEQEKTLPTPNIGGPRELPKAAARGSWRRSDGQDWVSTARSSDASLATVSTNEIFSVRLVQSSNPNAGGLNPISPGVGGVSPLLGGMGIRGAAPVVNVRPPLEGNRAYGERSQDTIGTFSEGSSGVDYERAYWESVERMFPQSGQGPGLGQWENNRASRYSVDSFQSHERASDENERGTWYQKRESSKDSMDDVKEYPVKRISTPLSPISSNVNSPSSSGQNVPGRPRLVEFTKEKRVESQSSSGHGSREVAFV